MKKTFIAIAIIAALSSCASFGSYSSSMPDLFLGKIQLALENYGSRTGTYTKGIYANFRSVDTGTVTALALDSDGFFESSSLDEGTYVFEGLFVQEFAVPYTRSFRVPFSASKLSIQKGQVNVFGDLLITWNQSGKSKYEFNGRLENMKALFATKAPNSPWLSRPWRSVFPASGS